MGNEKRNSIWSGDHNSSRTGAKFRIGVPAPAPPLPLLEYGQLRRFGKLTGEDARLTLRRFEKYFLKQTVKKPGGFRNGFCFSKNSPGYFRARAIRVPCKMSSAKLP